MKLTETNSNSTTSCFWFQAKLTPKSSKTKWVTTTLRPKRSRTQWCCKGPRQMECKSWSWCSWSTKLSTSIWTTRTWRASWTKKSQKCLNWKCRRARKTRFTTEKGTSTKFTRLFNWPSRKGIVLLRKQFTLQTANISWQCSWSSAFRVSMAKTTLTCCSC